MTSCREPSPSDPSPAVGRGRVAIVLAGGFRRLGVLDEIPGLEQHALGDGAPFGPAPEQELQIHREVLVLLVHRISDHRNRFRILLQRQPLLIPIDGLGLLGQRREDTSDRAGLL